MIEFKQTKKMANILLNEKAQGQIQEIFNELPISALSKVQKLISIMNENVVTEEDPKPIGGGGGSPIKPPKSE